MANSTIKIGTVTVASPDHPGSVTNSGTPEHAILDFILPKGKTGEQGPKGDKGGVGTTGLQGVPGVPGSQGERGPAGPEGAAGKPGLAATIAVAPGSAGVVKNIGTPSAAVLEFSIPKGETGAQGLPGKPGESATVFIGSVTSGDAPKVTNVGTPHAAILDIVLPKGDTGEKGDCGPKGEPGEKGEQGLPGPKGETGLTGLADFIPTTPKRELGVIFFPSLTKAVWVSYTIEIACTATLAGGQSGTVELLSGFGELPADVRASVSNSASISLAISATSKVIQRAQLSYLVPPGHCVCLASSGTAKMSIVHQSEVVLG